MSNPRMMGRLAPGAKVEAMMPGWLISAPARVALGVLTISSAGTTVTEANASSAILAVAFGAGGASDLAGAAFRAALGAGFFAALATGLGVVTTIAGNCV